MGKNENNINIIENKEMDYNKNNYEMNNLNNKLSPTSISQVNENNKGDRKIVEYGDY